MKIVLATPLYPPDIAPPAPYVKELAKRLAGSHQVALVTYGKLPEQVAGVSIIAVPKSSMLPLRLLRYTFALLKAARSADVVYAQNGASVELPAALIALFTRRPLVVGLSDESAHNRARRGGVLGSIERFALGRAKTEVTNLPLERPEILPFGPKPEPQLQAYEASWKEHVMQLESVFATVRQHGN